MSTDITSIVSIFKKEDGALPDIELNNLLRDEVTAGYLAIRDHAQRISSTGHCYWSKSKQTEIKFTIKDNPAALVVSGEAEPFHLCFDGIKSPNGKRIPELGIFVFTDGLSIDYSMGVHWTFEAVEGLFELIRISTVGFKNMQLAHKSNIYDIDGKILEGQWLKYIQDT